jgi:hypothetical protein
MNIRNRKVLKANKVNKRDNHTMNIERAIFIGTMAY